MVKEFTTALQGNDSWPSLKKSTIESYSEPAEARPHRHNICVTSNIIMFRPWSLKGSFCLRFCQEYFMSILH